MAKRQRVSKNSKSVADAGLFVPTFDGDFFRDNYAHLRLPPEENSKGGFRRAQLAAIHELAGHFLSRKAPGLVVMPTGSGKTGVLMVAPFLLRAQRVLVVTPARLVRSQVTEQFENLALLRNLGALDATRPSPVVVEQTSKITSDAKWERLRSANVVVATPLSISPVIKGIPPPPPDLFDVVLVDEAHHEKAPAWNALIKSFPSARVALFTATPFRRDKQRLDGELVYSYPMKEAYNDGVFGKIAYEPVVVTGGTGNSTDAQDIAIAQAAEKTLRRDIKAGFDHRLLVRIDSLPRARRIAAIYQKQTNLRLGLVHSGMTYSRAKKSIAMLKSGQIEGVICVNMLGEGFDLPQLKVAAIHSPHKSLAVTLQFIGRFARVGGAKLGTATFLAAPSEVQIEKTELFKEDVVWQEIITHLHASAVAAETEARRVVQTFEAPKVFDANIETLSLHSLFPRFHAKVYNVADGADMSAEVRLSRPFQVVFRQVSPAEHTTVLIVADRKRMPWCTSPVLARLEYDLIVAYHDVKSGLLFVNASRTNDSLYESVGGSLAKGAFRNLPLYRMNRVLAGLTDMRFPSIGMKNRVHGANTESYRTMSGSQPERAVRPLDGRLFHRGHLLCVGTEQLKQVTIGYSSSSKLWTIGANGTLAQLIQWCKGQAEKIANDKATVRPSGIDNLPVGEPLIALPTGLIAVDWDPMVYARPPAVEYGPKKGRVKAPLTDCDLAIDRGALTASRIRLHIRHNDEQWSVDFEPAGKRLFSYATRSANALTLDVGTNEVDLIDYLNNQPLEFYFTDFSRVKGEELFTSPMAPDPFERSRIMVIDWAANNVDIQKEFGASKLGMSIHTFLKKYLDQPAHQVVLYDHGSGEMADFVTIADSKDVIDIRLYHCKGSGGSKPGNRVGDVYEVCGQVVKSFEWLLNGAKVVVRVRRRIQKKSRFIRGNIATFEKLLKGDQGKPRKYTIVAVQPGITKKDLSVECSSILAAASEYCRRAGAEDLLVLGSD